MTFEIKRMATAAIGALILSSSFVVAAVGPATASTATAPAAYAQVESGTPDRGPGQAAHG